MSSVDAFDQQLQALLRQPSPPRADIRDTVCTIFIKRLSEHSTDRPLDYDTLQRAFALLRDSSGLRTPPRPPHRLLPALESPTPQHSTQLAAEALQRVGEKAWFHCARLLKDVRRAFRNNDEPDIMLYLENFLGGVAKHQEPLARQFSHIAACVFSKDELSHYLSLLREIFAKVLAWHPEPTDQQALAYVLAKFPFPHRKIASSLEDDATRQDLKRHLQEAFRGAYRGDAHHRLFRFTIMVNRSLALSTDVAPYYKGTPVVQSSGTGKTRLVLQLGNIAPLLFFCIRPSGSGVDQGYPLADDAVVSFLLSDPVYAHLDGNTKAAAILAGWFETLALDLAQERDVEAKHRLLLDLNAYGTPGHEQRRSAFFQRVADRAKQVAMESPADAKHDVVLPSALDGPVADLSCQLKPLQRHLAAKANKTGGDAQLHDDDLPHIYVAIDECVNLGPKLLECFRRAWNHIGTLEARNGAVWWLLLTSTSSGAASLIRPSRDASSLREVGIPSMPTFFAVGFDTLRAQQPRLQRAIDATEHGYVALFGRPLWSSLIHRSFWATAMTKLIGAEEFLTGNVDMSFSILGSRLALRFVPTRSVSNEVLLRQVAFAHKAVDRHMRLLTAIESDAALHISSPSEPVLAIAAALSMLPTAAERAKDESAYEKAKNRYGSILETLRRMCSTSQTIDLIKGTRGELVARLLWMTASDAALVAQLDLTRKPSLDERARHLLQPVAVDVLLASLVQLGADDQAQVQRRIDEVCHCISASGDAAGAKVRAWTHFSHFDILEVAIDEISPHYLWYCWKRGVAVQLAHQQHGIDGLIPVFVGDLQQPFGSAAAGSHADEAEAARHMTYIAWEAKNRSKTYAALAQRAAAKDKHAGPAIRRLAGGVGVDVGVGDEPLTQRSLLTVLADVGAACAETNVAPIGATGALQVWIRGVEDAHVYPCLDQLDIRDVVVDFTTQIAQRIEYGPENTLPNPMALDQAELQPDADTDADADVEAEQPILSHEAMNED